LEIVFLQNKGPATFLQALYPIKKKLLLLVAVLAQAFFTLVRSHFMSFSLFTARHSC
jgi:hypothetical protein